MSRGKTGFDTAISNSRTSIGFGTVCFRLPVVVTTHFGITGGAGVIMDTNPCVTCKMKKGAEAGVEVKKTGASVGRGAFNDSTFSHFSTNLKINITTRFNQVVMKLSKRFNLIGLVSVGVSSGPGGVGYTVALKCGFWSGP